MTNEDLIKRNKKLESILASTKKHIIALKNRDYAMSSSGMSMHTNWDLLLDLVELADE